MSKSINSVLRLPGATLQEKDTIAELTTSLKVDDIEIGDSSVHFYGESTDRGYWVICVPLGMAGELIRTGKVKDSRTGIVYTLKR